jgi:acetyl-CoA carboxylase alpha subunit
LKHTFLDFEQPIADLQTKIDELRYVHEDSAVDISDEITRLQKKSLQLTKDAGLGDAIRLTLTWARGKRAQRNSVPQP